MTGARSRRTKESSASVYLLRLLWRGERLPGRWPHRGSARTRIRCAYPSLRKFNAQVAVLTSDETVPSCSQQREITLNAAFLAITR